MTQPEDVEYASQLYQDWLAALKRQGLMETLNQSQAVMRGFMWELRRHMTTDQVLAFADALPALPRGIFLERWRPAAPEPLASAEAFTAALTRRLSPHTFPPDSVVADVFTVWASHVPARNAALMRDLLPEPLRPLWPENPVPAGLPTYLVGQRRND